MLEVEVTAIYEALKWLSTLLYHNVAIESDSFLSVQALNKAHDYILEVGYILDECKAIIRSRPGLTISFAKRQANKSAHLMARIPVSLGGQSTFTSPPNVLLETLMYDAVF